MLTTMLLSIAQYRLRVLLSCDIHFLGPVDYSWSVRDFPCIPTGHVQTMRVLLPPLQRGASRVCFLVRLLR